MNFVSLDEARRKTYDFIIVGTSFSAMFFAHGLRGKGYKILFVERGRLWSHQYQVKKRANRPDFPIKDKNVSGHPKEWVAHIMFGGNSNCWTGCIPRLHPNDFRTHTLYGQGADWPLTYDDLEPFYAEVEYVMDANGGGSDHILPRSRPFPFQPHAPTRADMLLRAHNSAMWFAQPTARSSGGRRPPCCSNGICYLCPVDAKFTILNGLTALECDEAECLLNAECRTVTTEAGAATGIHIRTSDGLDAELQGSNVVLAANALSNAAILMRSRIGGASVGKGVVEQVSNSVIFNVDFTNFFGGTIVTGHGYDLYDGAFRRDRAGVLIEVRNDLEPQTCRLEPGKWLNCVRFKLIAEDLPQEKNQIRLENDEPVIEWHGHSTYAYAGLDTAVDQLAGLLPFEAERTFTHGYSFTESHIQGGTVMSTSRETGVVDNRGRVHEVQGLYAVGAGMFPTCPPANPTLTLSALSLRAGTLV